MQHLLFSHQSNWLSVMKCYINFPSAHTNSHKFKEWVSNESWKRSAALTCLRVSPGCTPPLWRSVLSWDRGCCSYTYWVNTALGMFTISRKWVRKCLADRTGAMRKVKQVAVLVRKLFGSLMPAGLPCYVWELRLWTFFRWRLQTFLGKEPAWCEDAVKALVGYGKQVSYVWIQDSISRFWSNLLLLRIHGITNNYIIIVIVSVKCRINGQNLHAGAAGYQEIHYHFSNISFLASASCTYSRVYICLYVYECIYSTY